MSKLLVMPVEGPTRATEAATEEWAQRVWLARAVRLAALTGPTIVSFALTWHITRTYPPHEVAIPTWLWWVGLILLATITMLGVDRAARRLLPLAALFKLSLVFPDEAPSRFQTAMRTGTTRQLQRRIEEIRRDGIDDPEVSRATVMLELVAALSVHDRLTRGHCERVRAYTDLVIEELGLPEQDAQKLRWAALLHDVGKIHVPAEILTKTTRPDQDEWELLKSHTWQGDRMIEPLKPWLGEWAHAVGSHHERWDGDGYPNGLAGENIHLGARIVAVVDAYDVMTSARSYKKPISAEEARAEIARCAGTQFDPRVVRAFLSIGLGRLRFAAGPLAWLANVPGVGQVAPVAPSVAPTVAPVATGATAAVSTLAAVATGGFGGVLTPDAPEELALVETPAEVVETDGTDETELPAPTSTTIEVDEEAIEPADGTTDDSAPSETTTTAPGGTTTQADSGTTTTQHPPTTQRTTTTSGPTTTAAPGAPAAANSTVNGAEDQTIAAPASAAATRSVTFTITRQPSNGDLDGASSATVTPRSGTASWPLSFTPDDDWTGTDSYAYRACIGAACDTATVTIVVNGVNDAPTVSGPSSIEGTAGSAITAATFTVSDIDDSNLTVTATGLPEGLSFNAAQRRLSGTPTNPGTSTATIRVTDPDGATDTHTVTISVAAPVAGMVVITEVLYEQTDIEGLVGDGTQDEFIELTNIGDAPVDLSGYRLLDHAPGGGRDSGPFWGVMADMSLDITLGNDSRGGGSVLAPGQQAVVWVGDPDRTGYTYRIAPFGSAYDHNFQLDTFDHAPSDALEYVDAGNPWGTLGWAGEDVWLLAPDGSVADYLAWNDGGTIEQEFSAHPAASAWNPSGEASLADAAEGVSIALGTPDPVDGTACWTFSTLQPGGGCADPRLTRDTDSAPGGTRVSSAGRSNYL